MNQCRTLVILRDSLLLKPLGVELSVAELNASGDIA